MSPRWTAQAMAALHARTFVTPAPWDAATFARMIDAPHAVCVGSDSGFALGHVVAGEAELHTITITPEQQGRGCGAALMTRFEAAVSDKGAVDLILEVAADNAPARALYTGRGFAQVGLRKGYYRTPTGLRVDALVLRKPLIHRPEP